MNEDTQPHWENSALLTIDMQRDFLSDGAHAIAGTSEVLPSLKRLTAAFARAGRPVVHVVRLYLPDGSNADLARRAAIAGGAVIAQPGTRGAELAEGVTLNDVPLETDLLLRGEAQPIGATEFVIFKPRWNAFFATRLDEILRSAGVDTVAVAGCNYPNCPRGTLFGASERDYRAVAISDSISGWSASGTAELAGIGVHTAETAEVVDALARVSDRSKRGRSHGTA